MGRLCEKRQSSVALTTNFLYCKGEQGYVSIVNQRQVARCPNCRSQGEEQSDGTYACPQVTSVCAVETFVGQV